MWQNKSKDTAFLPVVCKYSSFLYSSWEELDFDPTCSFLILLWINEKNPWCKYNIECFKLKKKKKKKDRIHRNQVIKVQKPELCCYSMLLISSALWFPLAEVIHLLVSLPLGMCGWYECLVWYYLSYSIIRYFVCSQNQCKYWELYNLLFKPYYSFKVWKLDLKITLLTISISDFESWFT